MKNHIRQPVYVVADNIISALGCTTDDNIRKITEEQTGIACVEAGRFSPKVYPYALVDSALLHSKIEKIADFQNFTYLERMMLLSIREALQHTSVNTDDRRCLFVIATTKGNIDALSASALRPATSSRSLWQLGERIRCYFNNPNRAIIVSNACVSGVWAVEIAARMLRNGPYDHAVVAGGDLVSRFVVSGFESFRALSSDPCKPYDIRRSGLTLGEGCATVVLSRLPVAGEAQGTVMILGGATSNDASHISAPDPAGKGLSLAIEKALEYSGMHVADIDAVCAHGTATIHNDNMESHALQLMNLSNTPVYGLKGYWGHTLGAAGIMETVATVQSLKKQMLFRTLGHDTPGTSCFLNITDRTQKVPLRRALKTASGFGGCNAALVLQLNSH